MAETFTAPQPFNVEIGPEPEVTPAGRAPVAGPSLPVLLQEITPEPDLYPRVPYGVVHGAIR